MNELIQTVLVYALPLLFAITLHEAAHAYAAKRFGDNTAYSMGRMTLDPLKHIDPIGTIVLPVVLFLATSGNFLIGYAKPVPVEFGRLRNPKRDMAWVSLAGPGANLVMAIMWVGALWAYLLIGSEIRFLLAMIQAGIKVNLVLMAFNLFPIPPLDGGRVLISFLPNRLAYKFARIEPYGFYIVLALVFTQIIYSWWLTPLIKATAAALSLIAPFDAHQLYGFLWVPLL